MRLECLFLPTRRAGALLMVLLWACIPVPVTGEVYQDRLIEPITAGETATDAWDLEDAEPEGRRFYSVEYQHYRDDYIDDSNENGL